MTAVIVTPACIMKRTVIILCSCFFVSQFGHSSELQERADKTHKNEQQPSECVALGQSIGGKRDYAFAGAVRKDGPAPDKDTLFEIGSITKVFTGILLAETVRAGKAKFDDPVGKHLPKEAVGEDSPLLDVVTLESLSIHESGLPRLPSDLFTGADQNNPYAHYDAERLYKYLSEFDKDDLEKPGENSYSNLGVGLLGHTLGLIWEKPYPDLLKEKIFNPLGMKNSYVQKTADHIPAEARKRFATGHNGGEAVSYWEIDALAPAGAIVSSAEDMLIFGEAVLELSDVPEELRASIRESLKTRSAKQALGWFRNKDEASHGGGTGGFRTLLKVNLADKSVAIDLKNSAGEKQEMKSEGDFSALEGFWQGTLDVGARKLRLVRYISANGEVTSFSIDQGCPWTHATKTEHRPDGTVAFSFPSIGGRYEGKVNGDNMTGTWSQGSELPLNMKRSAGMPDILKKGIGKRFTGDLKPLAGYWSGYLGGREGLFVYVRVKNLGGAVIADLFSPDQHPAPIMVTKASVTDKEVFVGVESITGGFKGTWNPEKKTINGKWTQFTNAQDLELKWSAEVPERE